MKYRYLYLYQTRTKMFDISCVKMFSSSYIRPVPFPSEYFADEEAQYHLYKITFMGITDFAVVMFGKDDNVDCVCFEDAELTNSVDNDIVYMLIQGLKPSAKINLFDNIVLVMNYFTEKEMFSHACDCLIHIVRHAYTNVYAHDRPFINSVFVFGEKTMCISYDRRQKLMFEIIKQVYDTYMRTLFTGDTTIQEVEDTLNAFADKHMVFRNVEMYIAK